MVSTLTLADLGIALFVANRYDLRKAVLFFLNPASIIITGYHNQFDNIAIFLAMMSILYYNEEEKFNKKDFIFVLFLTFSLTMKHVFFIFPFFILIKVGLPTKKRLVYSFVPPAIFLLSFVPFAIKSKEAFDGIINNVFLYNSFNNSPLLSFLYGLIGFPTQYSKIVYGIGMVIVAFIIRKKKYEQQVYIYLIAMVALSSAIANQYLVIPVVAIIALETGLLKYIYIFFTSLFLSLHSDGLGLQYSWINRFAPNFVINMCDQYVRNGYSILAWILFITLLYVLFKNEIKRVCTKRTVAI